MVDKHKISVATSKLESLIVNNTFDESTQSALIYFEGNKDKLKYLLSAYPLKYRYNKLIDHLRKEFGAINEDMLTTTIVKSGIWDIKYINKINNYLPLIIIIILYISIVYFLKIDNFSNLGALLLAMFFPYFITGIILDVIFSGDFKPYRYSREYRSLAKPRQTL